MERTDDAPLADPAGGSAVPNDMPREPDEEADVRPQRTDEQTAEPRPDDDA